MAEISAKSGGNGSGGKTTPSETVRPGQSDTADEQSPSRPATPSRSTRLKRRMLSPIKDIFRRQASPANQSAPSREETPDQGPEDASTPAPETLISPGTDVRFEEGAISDARKIDMCDKAILAITIFEKAVKLTEFVLPSGISDTLETLVGVIEVLKQMVENREAWKDLLLTLDDHRKQFNGHIVRLKQENVKRDPNSPLLEPLGRYSEALRGLTAKVINDSGLVQGNTPATPAWSKIKKFITQYMEAESEKEKIQDYHDELLAAMRDLLQGLVIYNVFESHDTNLSVGRMEPAIQDIKQKLDLIVESIAAPLASKRKVKAKAPPHVTPFYVKREAEWKLMMDHLINSGIPGQKILPITGMGGCGKTQMVAYFLQQNKAMFPYVIYVDASSEASIKADLQTWAQSLGDGHEQNEWEDGLRLLSDKALDGTRVYILDNADDPKLTATLTNFLPDSDAVMVTVIITSRNKLVGNLATNCHLQMGEMKENEALSTLLRAARRQLPITPEELKIAHALIKEMGGLALALVQAGAYCYSISPEYTFGQYLILFRSKRANLMKKDQLFPLDKYERGVYTTLDLSYEVMSASTKEFFHFTSAFSYSDIPVAMLEAAAKNHFDDPMAILPRPEGHRAFNSRLNTLLCNEGDWKEFQTEEIIQNLQSFSLVSTTVVDDSLFLRYHPLVLAWIRDKRPYDAGAYQAMTTQVVTSCCSASNISIYRHLLPHIIEVLEGRKMTDLHVNDQGAFAMVLLEVGRYNEAEQNFKNILEKLQQLPASEGGYISWIIAMLSKVYICQRQWSQAEKTAVRLLEQLKEALGPEHQATLVGVVFLAVIYVGQGRLTEAENCWVDVLKKRTETLGVDDSQTISAASNLAITYYEQGRFSKAEKLGLDVLEQQRRILGENHLDTILMVGNLATFYRAQGRLDEAEKLELEVLDRRTKILGPDHPDTIIAAGNLAGTYYDQGRFYEAEKLGLDVLEKREKILGEDHPGTIGAADKLAATYRKQGRFAEAERLGMEVLEKFTRLLGTDHQDTRIASFRLAQIYHAQGRLDDATRLELDLLEKQTRILGPDHPDTIRTSDNLAATYYTQRRFSEAGEFGSKVMEKRRRILGEDHPETVEAAGHLAAIYGAQGRLDEAETLACDVLEKLRRIHGPKHPDTIAAALQLVAIHHKQGRLVEAPNLMLVVLKQRKNALGEAHPDIVEASDSQSSIYRAQGRLDDARGLDATVADK